MSDFCDHRLPLATYHITNWPAMVNGFYALFIGKLPKFEPQLY